MLGPHVYQPTSCSRAVHTAQVQIIQTYLNYSYHESSKQAIRNFLLVILSYAVKCGSPYLPRTIRFRLLQAPRSAKEGKWRGQMNKSPQESNERSRTAVPRALSAR